MARKSVDATLLSILLLSFVKGSVAYARIRNYVAATNVAPHLRLDLDLAEMSRHLNKHPQSRDLAFRVYEEGGHACTHAEITLQAPLVSTQLAGKVISQGRDGDWRRKVRMRSEAGQGTQKLTVEYNSLWRPCFGGGSSETSTFAAYNVERPLKWHCLDTLTPLMNDTTLAAIGTPTAVDNWFQSLKAMSVTADSRMSGESIFETLKAFHGSGDFAHQFLLDSIDSSLGRPLLPNAHRSQPFRIVTPHVVVFMTVWMEVVHQLERATYLCTEADESDDDDCVGADCTESPLHAWDKAAAYYAGSSWDSFPDSIFLDGRANQLCIFFGTCTSDMVATVNERVFSHLVAGQGHLQEMKCEAAAMQKDSITRQMYVPLVQGLLRSAYALATQDDIRRDRVETALYARTLQPRLQQCDERVRAVLEENVLVAPDARPMSAGYAAFKASVEATYPCLGITCHDVGGLLDLDDAGSTMYRSGAAPCGLQGDESTESTDEERRKGASTSTAKEESSDFPVAVVALVAAGACLCGTGVCAWWAWKCGFKSGRRYAQFEFENEAGLAAVPPSPVAPNTIGSEVGKPATPPRVLPVHDRA